NNAGIGATASGLTLAALGDTTYQNRPLGTTATFTGSSAVASGFLRIGAAGAYTFRTAADDQSILFIDGQAVLSANATGGGAAITDSNLAAVTLDAGLHSF